METQKQTSTIVTQPLNWQDYYLFIKGFAVAGELTNTLIALSVAIQAHENQFRKGGEPYIIHPLRICSTLIHLGIKDDIMLATAILHDFIEDCDPTETGDILVTQYGLDEEIRENVLILSKSKNYKKTDPTEEKYYAKISSKATTALLKVADRTDNLSTISSFTVEKKKKYVKETKDLVYPLCSYIKKYYPQYSKEVTILKYRIVSICEAIESLCHISNLTDDIDVNMYKKTFNFIKGYARFKEFPNTMLALNIAKTLHKNQVRTIGDPFIIHPLRVCSYLISLKINDDITCSAALLHEMFKKCNVSDDAKEILDKWDLDPKIIDIVKLVSPANCFDLNEYYEKLKTDIKAILIKLSNRAHTCTLLCSYDEAEKKRYIEENVKYILPLCEYAETYYPMYSDEITIMKDHIMSISNVVENLSI